MKKGCLLLLAFPVTLPALGMTLDGVMLGYDHTGYSTGYGTKNITYAELKSEFDSGAAVMNVSRGSRDYGHGASFQGTRGRMTVWYDWSPMLSTRTGLSLGDNSPVFVRREVLNDFNLKLLKGMVLTAGGRHASYWHNTEVNAFSAGGTWYTGPVILAYRYTTYDTVGVGGSYSHLVSIRLRDSQGPGYTQLFMSTGTGAYTYDWSPTVRGGELYSLSLKRVQPLTPNVDLNLVAGKQWFETPVSSYSGLNGQLALTWRW
ncbi:YaiO family outer membrane beta-barrel protein [Salmonella enterica subsp. enterica serovar Newport]|nr:YaiO family outer membrane beta-barrel protein [Salmonella enterica subsp. enterica serovar Newport]